jgi:molybdopterin/thiamine biosynthesis adenylyltransferase
MGLKCSAGDILKTLRMFVVGNGSVGRRMALHAARLQPAALWLIDPGRYELENLATQPILPADLGQSKALNTGRACKAISPRTRVFVFEGKVQSLDLLALEPGNVVLLATDNLPAEVHVGQVCFHLGKLLIQATVHGESLVAHVRVLTNHAVTGPCLACGNGSQEWDDYHRNTIFSCSGPGPDTTAAPTRSTAFLCSLAADLGVTQAARHVLGLGQPVGDTLLEYCGYTHATTVSPLARNPRCPCDHTAWKLVTAPACLSDCRLRDLANAAGLPPKDAAPADLSFRVEDYQFIDSVFCCGRRHAARRFVAPEDPVMCCVMCGRETRPQEVFSSRWISAASLAELLDEPLQRLGARCPRWVVVKADGRATLLRQEVSSC